MPRSADLDIIAPDDQIPATPAPTPKPKKIKKSLPPSPTTLNLEEKIRQIVGHSRHPLTSFLVRPNVFNFQEKDNEEIIYLVLRQHWFTNLKWILSALIMLFVPIFLNFIPLLDFFPGNYQFVFILFWYILTFAYAFESFLSWYFDVYIVTDHRVVDIDFNNLLNKSFSEADLTMIQDLSYDVRGIAQTIFNYATIRIQTAAEVPEIEFENVSSPEKVVKVLRELKEAREGRP